jgi:hypothetical protein
MLLYINSLLVGWHSAVRLRRASGWTIRGSKPGGSEIFHTRPDQPPIKLVPSLSQG